MRRVLRAAPGAHGYEVVEAASREEALRRLDSEDCDFVLLDLNLPGLAATGLPTVTLGDSSKLNVGDYALNVEAVSPRGTDDALAVQRRYNEVCS